MECAFDSVKTQFEKSSKSQLAIFLLFTQCIRDFLLKEVKKSVLRDVM